jgi:hypothetical protein
MTYDNYYKALNCGEITKGENTNLQLYNGVMSKVTVAKNVLRPIVTKYRVTKDF